MKGLWTVVPDKRRPILGLENVGLCRHSGNRVLHLWSRMLSPGMFDGSRSGMVAPENHIYYGLTKRLVVATFLSLSVPQRCQGGISLPEALAHKHDPVTSVYNVKRNAITSRGISEWAATLTGIAAVLRRTLPSATHDPREARSVLHRFMQLVDSFADLVRVAYFSPR